MPFKRDNPGCPCCCDHNVVDVHVVDDRTGDPSAATSIAIAKDGTTLRTCTGASSCEASVPPGAGTVTITVVACGGTRTQTATLTLDGSECGQTFDVTVRVCCAQLCVAVAGCHPEYPNAFDGRSGTCTVAVAGVGSASCNINGSVCFDVDGDVPPDYDITVTPDTEGYLGASDSVASTCGTVNRTVVLPLSGDYVCDCCQLPMKAVHHYSDSHCSCDLNHGTLPSTVGSPTPAEGWWGCCAFASAGGRNTIGGGCTSETLTVPVRIEMECNAFRTGFVFRKYYYSCVNLLSDELACEDLPLNISKTAAYDCADAPTVDVTFTWTVPLLQPADLGGTAHVTN
jgi:hypothetical protein